MMYRVTLYNWVSHEQIGTAYDTNVMPTPGLLIAHGDGGRLWEVVNVMHQVQQPGSHAADHGDPELLQVMVGPGREQFL